MRRCPTNNMAGWCLSLFRLLKIVFYLAISGFCIHVWIENKKYIFDVNEIHAIARKHSGKNVKSSMKLIVNVLRERYPGHILPNKHLQWIFVNSGGSMKSMCVLHASLTEYMLFHGAAIESSGHSGRLWANISDTLLSGSLLVWKEGEMTSQTFQSGETLLHNMGDAASISTSAGTWIFEYGRGFIPSTLGFALADTIFSTQDFLTLFYTFRVYSRSVIQETGLFLTEFRQYLKELL